MPRIDVPLIEIPKDTLPRRAAMMILPTPPEPRCKSCGSREFSYTTTELRVEFCGCSCRHIEIAGSPGEPEP